MTQPVGRMQVNQPEQRHCLERRRQHVGQERTDQSSPAAALAENQVNSAAMAISKLENRVESLIRFVVLEYLLQDDVVERLSTGEGISEIPNNEVDAMFVGSLPSF